jgi:two-component system chemotaxis sensor kinase CheA
LRSARFFDLYVTETREHHALLVRSILRLEGGEAAAVEDAFRAAHTIKGLAAAMGHRSASAAAHGLEDRLAQVRSGAASLDAALGDELLRAADTLEAAIARGLAGAEPDEPDADGDTPSIPPADAGQAADLPSDTAWIVEIRLSAQSVLPEARAVLIRRGTDALGGVLGDDTSRLSSHRELRLFLSARADPAAMANAIRAAGEVAEVRVVAPPRADSARVPAGRDGSSAAMPAVERPVAATVRVDRARLDEIAEGIAELSVLHARAPEAPNSYGSDRSAAVLAQLQRTILDLRMVPVSTAFERLARVVRDASRAAGKDVEFDMRGGEIELDQSVLDALVDPLVHLLRNAVDHGIEPAAQRVAAGKPAKGSVRLETMRERSSVRIVVSDDGGGVSRAKVTARGLELGLLRGEQQPSDDDLFRLVFQPGFSTAAEVTELSGRGVGLDVVAARVRQLGGAIEMTTTPGAGTTFTLRVPITLALMHALRVLVGGEDYALPLTNVSEVVSLEGHPAADGARGAIRVRGDLVPLVDLARVLGAPALGAVAAVVAELGGRRVALAVDRVVGHEQILIKTFDAPHGTLPVFSGVTVLADGRPALLIDPLSVL